MSSLSDYFDRSARTAVPFEETVSGWSVGLVLFGICLTLPTLYTGASLVEQLGFLGTSQAVLIASLVLALMSIPAAIVGAETRLSSYLIIEFVFGRRGSDYVNALLGLTLLGWFAVTAGFFGETLAIASTGFFGSTPPVWLLTLVSSGLIILTTLFGFRAIDRLALLAVPILILFLLYTTSLSVSQSSWETLLHSEAANPAYFSTAVSTVIGSLIVGVVLMPDLSRYARTRRDCISASILGNGLGNLFSMLMGVAPALVTGLLDPMAWMISLGLLGSAFTILVFATWTTNSVNLYSTTLAVAIIRPETAEWKLAMGCGVLGTVVAMMGITDFFVVFLEWLGVIVPPVAGIYLTDYFILGQKDYSLDLRDKLPDYDSAALLAWLFGTLLSVLAFVTDFSISHIPSLDALLITVPVYLLCRRRWPNALQRTQVCN